MAMSIQPFIVGSGMSGRAITHALSIIRTVDRDLAIAPPVRVARGQPLDGLANGVENPLLCIGNPHGLHARYILEGAAAGFKEIVADKPACVSLEDIRRLQRVNARVVVLHGYRQMWGPQTLKRMLADGEFGQIIALEGRYWQSSAAEFAAGQAPGQDKTWKNDLELNGPYDTLIDLGTHWADLMIFLAGQRPSATRLWLSHANAIAPHRDTHVHLYFEFADFRSLGSISKTLHGAGSELAITVLGTKRAASWKVGEPEEIRVSRGAEVSILRRPPHRYGSQLPPYHGTGWLEGYTEIIHAVLLRKIGKEAPAVPTLAENLIVLEELLTADPL